MPRRARVQKRVILPDPIYGSVGLAKFVNCIMLAGKKSIAEKIVYDSFEKIRRSSRKEPLDVFDQAIRNVTPEGIRALVELFWSEVVLCYKAGSSRPEEGSEHFWAYNLEFRTGRSFAHGDLIALGYRHGPLLGRALAELLAAVVDDPGANRRTTLLARARELLGA